MKRLLLTIGAGLAFAAASVFGAQAADLGPRVFKAPPPAPVSSWAGFYIGVNGGGGIARGSFQDPCFTCADLTISEAFATAGGQAGFNWQWRAFVAGIEADFNWMSANKTLVNAADDSCCIGTATFKMDAFTTIRGRMGLAYDNALIYVTAGGVWAHVNSDVALCTSSLCTSSALDPDNNSTATSKGWRPGVVVGAGTEYMLTNNLTLRGEFLYMMFKDDNTNYISRITGAPITCINNGGSRNSCGVNFNNDVAVARLGLNWKFGGY